MDGRDKNILYSKMQQKVMELISILTHQIGEKVENKTTHLLPWYLPYTSKQYEYQNMYLL